MQTRRRREPEVVLAVLARLDRGESARAIALATGIPYETIRKWQRGRIPWKARRTAEGARWCADCGAEEHAFGALPGRQYAYLLGIYLATDAYTGTRVAHTA